MYWHDVSNEFLPTPCVTWVALASCLVISFFFFLSLTHSFNHSHIPLIRSINQLANAHAHSYALFLSFSHFFFLSLSFFPIFYIIRTFLILYFLIFSNVQFNNCIPSLHSGQRGGEINLGLIGSHKYFVTVIEERLFSSKIS